MEEKRGERCRVSEEEKEDEWKSSKEGKESVEKRERDI